MAKLLDGTRIYGTANVDTQINVGANVAVNTSVIFVGNSTVNTVISANTITLNGTNLSTAITSNAATAYTNAVAFAANATNLSSGTVANARLNSSNTTQAGIVQLVDSVANVSVTLAGTANSVKTAYDAAISANTRAASAQTAAESAYSNATAFAANADNITSGTVANARLNAANTTAAGIVQLVDSVANVSVVLAGTANSVKTAYDTAISANTRAASAQTAAASAYTNAIAYSSNADNISSGTVANARLNAANTTAAGIVQLVDSVANVSVTIAATANSVKVAYDAAIAANTRAASAQTAAGQAYANGVSYTDTIAGQAYSNAVSYADTKAAAAYSNAVSYTDTKAGQAYSNAVAYAASNTYVNSTFAPLAGATFTGAVSGITTLAAGNTTITGFANVSGGVRIDGTLAANDVTVAGNLTVSGTTTFINTNTLNIGDNIITLNADMTGDPTENAGVEINRGNSANVALRWSETADQWQITSDGTSYVAVASNNDVTTAYTNATSYADTKAATAYSNAIAYAANASNISSGTLDTARLPATANVSTAINVGANVNANTTAVKVGNTTITTTNMTLGGTVTANGSTGTSGYVLKSGGTANAYWDVASGGGATLVANTTDSQTFYIPMANATSGSWTNAVVSSTKLTYVPSTGKLSVTGEMFTNGVVTATANGTTIALRVTDGNTTPAWIGMIGKTTTSSAYNPLTVAGDAIIIASNNGNGDTTNLMVGPHSSMSGGHGIRFQAANGQSKVAGNSFHVTIASTDRLIVNSSVAAVTGTVVANNTSEAKAAPSISTNTLTLDLAAAAAFEVSLNANITTLTLSNTRSSGYVSSFLLVFVGDGTARSVTWPASFKWPSGTAPTLTSTLNKKDAFFFFTYDGGTSWQAFICGQNM